MYKRVLAIILVIVSIMSLMPILSITAKAEVHGVQDRIDMILETYPTNSYFTVASSESGCTGSQHTVKNGIYCDGCLLLNIPSRGNLSSGAEVRDGESDTCCGFANYVFYNIFGISGGCVKENSKIQFKTSGPVLGDACFNGKHWFIYLSEDDDYYYVYDANGVGAGGNKVVYDHKYPKSLGEITEVYHAKNYNEINCTPAPSISYDTITEGTYRIRNKSTGKYLNADGTTSKSNISVASEVNNTYQKFKIGSYTSDYGYAIIPSFDTTLRVNPFSDHPSAGTNVNLYPASQEFRYDQHWLFEQVNGGYIIHNMKYTKIVLGLDGNNVTMCNYTGASNQIWVLDPEIAPHTHTKGSIWWNDSVHPHNYVYECPICHKNWTDFNSSRYMSDCAQCNQPGKPAFETLQTLYSSASPVALYWNETQHTSFYTICVEERIAEETGGSENWQIISQQSNVKSGHTILLGSGYYRAKLTANNSGSWTGIGTKTLSTAGDYAYFTVVDSASIAQQPNSVKGKIGELFSLKITAAGEDLRYQWQVYRNDVWTNAEESTANSSVFRGVIPAEPHETQYRCVVSDKYGFQIISDAATVSSYEYVASGKCGDDLTWYLDETGCLSVHGTGPMWDFDSAGGLCGPENRNLVIKQVVLYPGVSYIGGRAFHFSYESENYGISIPDTVIAIQDSAFDHSWGASSIQVSESNPFYSSDGIALFDKQKTVLYNYPINGPVDYSIPETVTKIGKDAFASSHIRSIAIPYGVTALGDGAFRGCYKIQTISLPATVQQIGESAFYRCEALEEISIPSGVTTIEEATFGYCARLSRVYLPESLLTISRYAFRDCGEIETVVIPNNVERICNGAFFYCSGLRQIFFMGDAPTIDNEWEDTFKQVKATAYYSAANPTWTEVKRQNYGGNLAWEPLEEYYAVAMDSNGYITSVPFADGSIYLDALNDGNYTITITGRNCIPLVLDICVNETRVVPITVPLVGAGNINGKKGGRGEDVSVEDMQCLFDFLSAGTRQGELKDDATYFDAVADVNADGFINILDYQALYEMIRVEQEEWT